jgi:hypothetical protein
MWLWFPFTVFPNPPTIVPQLTPLAIVLLPPAKIPVPIPTELFEFPEPPAITKPCPTPVVLVTPPIIALSVPFTTLFEFPVLVLPITLNEPVITAEPVNGNGFEAGAFKANEAVVANDAEVANDADVAILAVDAFCTLLTVIPNVDASALVNVISALLIDAVVTNEPVLMGITFNANDAVVANEADVANDADVATDALIALLTLLVTRANVVPSPLVNVVVASFIDAVVTNEPVLIGVTFSANEAVVANEEVTCKLVISLPVPSVRMFLLLPEICTKSSYVEAIVCPVKF